MRKDIARTPECKCLNCGTILNSVGTCDPNVASVPEPGDVTVCIRCGVVAGHESREAKCDVKSGSIGEGNCTDHTGMPSTPRKTGLECLRIMKITLDNSGSYLEPDEPPRNSLYHMRIVRVERIPGTLSGNNVTLECGHGVQTFGNLAHAEGRILCTKCRDFEQDITQIL